MSEILNEIQLQECEEDKTDVLVVERIIRSHRALATRLAAAEKVDDTNCARIFGMSIDEVRNLQAEATRLRDCLAYVHQWNGCTFRLGAHDDETDTYPVYMQCGITDCGSIAEFYSQATGEWFVKLLTDELTALAQPKETPQ